jgi:PPOX class probable F420-dependent enzyme
MVKTVSTQGPRGAGRCRDDEHERTNGTADRGADFVRKHRLNRHGFPAKAGKTVKTRLNPGHEWVCNRQEVTGVTQVTGTGAWALRLTASEARRRFGTATVARLATVGPGGRPHLIPVTFALDGDRIYTAVDAKPKTTANLRRLRNIGADPRVAVLADHYSADWDALWWARADGLATILRDPADMPGPLELLAARYPQYRANPPTGPVIAIAVERWTGWAASTGPG